MKRNEYLNLTEKAQYITDPFTNKLSDWTLYNYQFVKLQLIKLGILFSPHTFEDEMHSIGMLYTYSNKSKIYFDTSQSPYRINFTIVHEMAHYYLHRKNNQMLFRDTRNIFLLKSDDKIIELEANILGSMILLPDYCLIRALYSGWTMDKICKNFGISKAALFVRIEQMTCVYFDINQSVAYRGAKILRYGIGGKRIKHSQNLAQNLALKMQNI